MFAAGTIESHPPKFKKNNIKLTIKMTVFSDFIICNNDDIAINVYDKYIVFFVPILSTKLPKIGLQFH